MSIQKRQSENWWAIALALLVNGLLLTALLRFAGDIFFDPQEKENEVVFFQLQGGGGQSSGTSFSSIPGAAELNTAFSWSHLSMAAAIQKSNPNQNPQKAIPLNPPQFPTVAHKPKKKPIQSQKPNQDPLLADSGSAKNSGPKNNHSAGENSSKGNGTGDGNGSGSGEGNGKGSGEGDGKGNGKGKGNNDEGAAYGKIIAKVNRAKRYPSAAQEQRLTGKVTVAFSVSPSGGLASGPNLVQSSGKPILDQAALDAVRRAAPFPYYSKTVTVRVNFVLKKEIEDD